MQLAYAISGMVANTILDDELWRSFGFSKRPRRGAFFSKFVSAERLQLETFILQENLAGDLAMWAIASSSIGRGGVNDPDVCEAMRVFSAGPGIAQATRYQSAEEMFRDVRARFLDYSEVIATGTSNGWNGPFMRHALARLPKDVAVRLLVPASTISALSGETIRLRAKFLRDGGAK